MFESIFTISLTGFIAGFIFAMPIAGPISIMITSNALKGSLRYCQRVSIGASIADFTYIFIAVYGITKLYSFYKPAIPYMFLAGAAFFLFLGFRIIRSKVDIEHFGIKSHLAERLNRKQKGGFYTGLMINFLNPTLFIGGLTSSFFVISLIASLGFQTGGLELRLDQNVKEISSIEGRKIDKPNPISVDKLNKLQIHRNGNHKKEHRTDFPSYFHLIISVCYALFLAAGSIAWFHLLAYLIVKYREHINIKLLSGIIKGLGVILCVLGVYFGYLSIGILF